MFNIWLDPGIVGPLVTDDTALFSYVQCSRAIGVDLEAGKNLKNGPQTSTGNCHINIQNYART